MTRILHMELYLLKRRRCQLAGKRLWREAWQQVFNLAGDKAPCTDGFPTVFFQHFWSVKKDAGVYLLWMSFTWGETLRILVLPSLQLSPKYRMPTKSKTLDPTVLLVASTRFLPKCKLEEIRRSCHRPSLILKVSFCTETNPRRVLIASECIHSRFKDKNPGVLC